MAYLRAIKWFSGGTGGGGEGDQSSTTEYVGGD